MCANHLSVLPKGIANYPKGRGEKLFLRSGPFHRCLLLVSWTLAQAKFPEHGHPVKLRWALLCRLRLLSKKWIEPKLLLNHNFKSNSDPLLQRVPIKCHKWCFAETVRYCSCTALVYLWQGVRQPIVMDVVDVCLSEVDTVCYGVVQSWAQEVATGASVYKWPGQNYTHKAIVSLFPC